MLINKVRKVAPTLAGVARASAIVLKGWREYPDKNHVRMWIWRYPTLLDATNDTNGYLLDKISEVKYRDENDDGTSLTIGQTAYYRIQSEDKRGNLSYLSAVLAITFTGTNTNTLVGTIGNAQIADGAVTDLKFSGTLSNSKLKLIDTTNIFKNPSFVGGSFDDWSSTSWTVIPKASCPIAGAPTDYVAQVTGNGSYRSMNPGDTVDVSPGEVWAVRFWVAAQSATAGNVYVQARFANIDNDTTYTYLQVAQALATVSSSGVWTEVSGFIITPATVNGKATAKMQPYVEIGNTVTVGTVWATNIRMRRASSTDMIAANAVTEGKVDANLPAAAGAAPSLTSLTADIDGDGTPDLGFTCAWSAIAASGSNPAARLYEVEIWRKATDKGTDGSITGYSLWRKFVTPDVQIVFEARRKYFHKARVRGMSFANQSGNNWSAYTNVGLQPNKFDAMTGVTPATPTAAALDNGILVSWVIPSSPTYAYTMLYQGATLITTINGTSHVDKTVRTAGTGYAYTVVHYDRAGNFTNSSAASNSAVYRTINAGDLSTNAVTPRVLKQTDKNNAFRDTDCIETSLFTAVGGTLQSIAMATVAESSSYLYLPASTSQLYIHNNFDLAVKAGKLYNASITFGSRDTGPATYNAYVNWYSMDAAGSMAYLSNSFLGTHTSSTQQTFEKVVTAPANARRAIIVVYKDAGANGDLCYYAPIFHRAVEDKHTDPTLPTTPTMSIAGYGSDFDLDGTLDAGLTITATNPNVGREIARYIVQLQRSDDGSTGWADWRRVVFDAEDVADSLTTLFQIPANRRKFYRAKIRSVTHNGKKSGWSGFTGTAQPSTLAGYTGQTVTAPSVVTIANGFTITGSLGALNSALFKEMEVLVGGVSLIKVQTLSYQDMTPRSLGAQPTYTIKLYDKAGGVSAVSGSTVPVTGFRGASSAEIAAGAVLAANIGTGLGGNYLPNSDQSAGLANWALEYSDNSALFTLALATNTYAPHPGAIQISQNDGSASHEYGVGPKNADGSTLYFSVEAGQYYELSTYYMGHRCTGVQLYIRWEDNANALVSHSSLGVFTAYQDSDPLKSLANYQRAWGKVQAPAGAVRAAVFFRHKGTRQGFSYTSSYLWLHKMYFGKASANQTEPTVWSPTAPNLIGSGNIQGGAVGTAALADGGVATVKLSNGAVTPIKADLGDTSNSIKDNQMSDISLWQGLSISGTVTVSSFTRLVNDGIGSSQYKLRLVSTATGAGSHEISTLPINNCSEGRRYGISVKFRSSQSGTGSPTLWIDWYGRDASGNAVSLGSSTLVDQNVTSPYPLIVTLEGSAIAPTGAAFFALRVRHGASSAGSLTIELGNPVVRESINGVFETLTQAGSDSVLAGNTKTMIRMRSNHTKAARFVSFSGSFKNVSGGTRQFTVEFIKIADPAGAATVTPLKTITVSLQDDNPFYMEYFDDAPSGSLTDYALRFSAIGSQLTINNRYMITQAFFG